MVVFYSCTVGNNVGRVAIGVDRISMGTSDDCVQVCQPLRITNFPNYDANTLTHDISLIELDCNTGYPSVWRLDDVAATVATPGTMLTVAGWYVTCYSNPHQYFTTETTFECQHLLSSDCLSMAFHLLVQDVDKCKRGALMLFQASSYPAV